MSMSGQTLFCLVFSQLLESVVSRLTSVLEKFSVITVSHIPPLFSPEWPTACVSVRVLQLLEILWGLFQYLFSGSSWYRVQAQRFSPCLCLVSSAREQYFSRVTIFWITSICLVPSENVPF